MAHVRRILRLVETYGRETVAQTLTETVELGAYGSDYLHHLLAHRRALEPVIGHLHLTRSAELLELEVPPPDCSRYDGEHPHGLPSTD
ncbi:MAG TPA: hypothetical protein VGD78_06780 [Chthoniobacterales bacterium]